MKAMVHEVDGKCKQGQLKMKRREQVEGSMKKIDLKEVDAADWCRWREGVGRVAEVLRSIQPSPSTGEIFVE